MAKKTENTVKLGLFITIAVALFIAGVYLIGSQENMFGATLRVSSVFGNVNGLQPGNNVRYSGINVGTVESIMLLNDSTVQVNMKLDKTVQPYIKKGAVASIGSDGLVGSMLVNISPGKGAGGMVEEGDVIASYSRVETEELLNTLGKTNENIALISNDLLRITNYMTRGKGTLALLLRDTQLAIGLREAIFNLQATSRSLAATGGQLQRLTGEVEEGSGLLNQLLYDTTVITNLNASISQIDTLAEKAMPVLTELRRSAEDIAASSAILKSAMQQLAEGEGAATLLLRDTAFANNLEQTMQHIEEGTARFNENMEAMRHNFLFRRYFKKKGKKGDGGAP
ncbi:MAG: MCE family protein [Lewinellaceae bacterium]|nr:MCE family protein [Phaeodactylibacter sp.]MCB9036278.1 MCE family protein [Lewinellaceae bacterium]